MKNKISIIVPVFNVEKYVKKCVDSILAQTYSNIEVILVNDGSKDDSGRIIEEISQIDNRVKVIHQQNGGVTKARNAGIRIANGEWIGFVDGDDWIEPNMYEILHKNALEYDADISHCGYQMVFPSRIDYYYNTKRIFLEDNRKGLEDLLFSDFIEPGLCNKLVKASIVKNVLEHNVIDSSIKNNEDLLMNYYFFSLSHKSIYYDYCPYHYFVRKGSASHSEKDAKGLSVETLSDIIKVRMLILNNTKDNAFFKNKLQENLIRWYIYGATMQKNTETQFFIDRCRNELHKIKKDIRNCSRYTKLQYYLYRLSPGLYRFIRKKNLQIKGKDKQYDIS